MAYYNKYKFTFATRANKTAYLYLQEDLASAPTVIEYQGVGVSLQYLPNSDDPFEPIFASQLGVVIDITDNLSNIPNLVTLDDRKYFARLFLDSTLEWCGWVLSDSVSIGFSTGRRQMSFNAIDGLGMLQDIALPQTFNTSINEKNNLLYFMRLCFNALQFQPSNSNIVIVCSYFSSGMSNRSVQSYNEPFIQSYLPYRTFLETPSTYKNCLEILYNIAKTFGCRIFQAGGKWWVVAINEFANQNNWYTEYNSNGTVVASGSNLNTLSTIQAYTGNTSGLYFINNSQLKLLKKGYNKVIINNSIGYPDNYMTNWNLRPLQNTNQPYNWNPATTSTGNSFVIVDNVDENYATYVLTRGSTPSSKMTIFNTGLPKVSTGDSLDYSMTFLFGSVSSGNGYVQFFITPTAGSVYYMDGAGDWSTNANNSAFVPANQDYAPFDFNIKSKPFPIDGQLSFGFFLDSTSTPTVTVGNFQLSLNSTLKSITYTAYTDNNKQYVNTIDVPYGFYAQSVTGSGANPIEIGALYLSNDSIAINWTRFGGAVGGYVSLQELLTQQYINIYGKNIINLDCDLSSYSTTNGILNASKLFKATDTDPSPINIASNSYMLGNSTTNYAENTTNATLLQISNTDIVCSFTNDYYYESSQF
jgi:hypothetical protein